MSCCARKAPPIDELQALIEVLSGNSDIVVNAEPEIVSLPGASPKDEICRRVWRRIWNGSLWGKRRRRRRAKRYELRRGGSDASARWRRRWQWAANVGDESRRCHRRGKPCLLRVDRKAARSSPLKNLLEQMARGPTRWNSVETKAKTLFGNRRAPEESRSPMGESSGDEVPEELTFEMVVKATDKLDGTDWENPQRRSSSLAYWRTKLGAWKKWPS